MCCAVNAAAGREAGFSLEPAGDSRRVVIVGGGPAGMETAKVAALRGHRVTLYERSQRLGGSLFAASVLNPENERLLKYLVRQVRSLPVEIKLGAEGTPELVMCSNPDVTVVATGARLTVARFRGDDRQDVISSHDLRRMMAGQPLTARLNGIQRLALYLTRPTMRYLKPSTMRWLTRIWMPLGKKITIIGGDFVACELADFLAQRGRKVLIVALHQELAAQMAIPARWRLIESLARNGVTFASGAKCEEITDKGVAVTFQDGHRQTVQTDTVIVAGETEPSGELADLMQGCGLQSQRAGDCSTVGFLAGAITDGAQLGMRL
jgi:NADPH-dependent 2,4-dienoyl-CoA reductase/sulfur reductase-like enzyme